MGNFLNIIIDDLDYIDGKHFYANERWTCEERINLFLKDIFQRHGFVNYRMCTLSEAENNKNECFYYFIVCTKNLSDVINQYQKLPFKDVLSDSIKKNKNIHVVFYNTHETDNFESFKLFNDQIYQDGYRQEQFHLINNNSNLDMYSHRINSSLNTYTSRDLPVDLCRTYSHINTSFIPEKKYLFTCYNGTAKLHRYAMLTHLHHENLLSDTDWSLIYGSDFTKRYFDDQPINYSIFLRYFDDIQINQYLNSFKQICSIEKKESEFESGKERHNYDSLDNESYINSYITIITESEFDNEQIHITEKSFKPFHFFQLPIFVATLNHVKKLRENYGFDMFDDLINHDYDDVHEPKERMNRIIEEIKRLHGKRDEVIEFYKKNEDRFQKNRELVFSKVANDKSEYNFFNELSNSFPEVKDFNLLYDENFTKHNIEEISSRYQFNNYKMFSLEDVKNNPSQKCFYFVIQHLQLTDAINQNNGKLLSEKLESYLITFPNLNLIYLNEHESDNDIVIKEINYQVEHHSLDIDRVYFVNCNAKIYELKNRDNPNVNVHKINLPLFVTSRNMSYYDSPFVNDKKYFFTCHNRMIKQHRIGILALLKKHSLLDDTDWSFLRGFNFRQQHYDNGKLIKQYYYKFFTPEDLNDLESDIEFLSTFDVKKSVYEEEYSIDNPTNTDFDFMKTYEINPYKNAYINITTETHYESNFVVHITEKSLLPFNFNQLPIFVASYQHVRYLKEIHGFDMFDDLIDHSYDEEPDGVLRLKMIINELKRLHLKKEEVIEFYKRNMGRFLLNRQIVLKLMKSKKDYNFFQNLIN
jgi:hypothetical protein